MQLQLSILTLNVWGIPFISKDRDIRIKAIGDILSTGEYDVVSLQEVWSESDYQFLKSRVHKVLPFAHYFYSGVFGSGLCILSKYPIVSTFFHAWSVNGYVHRVQHGDWFGGKGVGLCKLNINDVIVNVYVAHLHAEYNPKNDDYIAHRVVQAFDTAQFIESTRGDAVLQVLAGDLNTERSDIAYRVLCTSSILSDSYQNEHSRGGTNECAKNTYTTPECGNVLPEGKRIDHILYRSGKGFSATVLDYQQPLPGTVPGETFSYSDHEAVHAKFLVKSEDGPPSDSAQLESHAYLYAVASLNESIHICKTSLDELNSHKRTYWMFAVAVILILVGMIDIVPPYGFKTLYLLFKIFLSGCVLFFVIMATIWNSMERNGLLSGKLAMEMWLKYVQLRTKNVDFQFGEENGMKF